MEVMAGSEPPSGVEIYQSRYNDFVVGDESTDYTMTVGTYLPFTNLPMGDSLNPPAEPSVSAHGMKFSTYDRDNDLYAGNCADDFQSGWWFNACTASNINGVYSWLANGVRDTSVPSIWWKYDMDTTGITTFDLKLKAI
jgi:hypothetical protein